MLTMKQGYVQYVSFYIYMFINTFLETGHITILKCVIVLRICQIYLLIAI